SPARCCRGTRTPPRSARCCPARTWASGSSTPSSTPWCRWCWCCCWRRWPGTPSPRSGSRAGR
ncbi:hypothetical protein FO489_23310, partial [Bacillus licheniformis]